MWITTPLSALATVSALGVWLFSTEAVVRRIAVVVGVALIFVSLASLLAARGLEKERSSGISRNHLTID
jgi:hypothetical protein